MRPECDVVENQGFLKNACSGREFGITFDDERKLDQAVISWGEREGKMSWEKKNGNCNLLKMSPERKGEKTKN